MDSVGRQEGMDRRQKRSLALDDDTSNNTPEHRQAKRSRTGSFSRFSSLSPDMRIGIWKNTLEGRIIKISPKLWDSKYKCRNIHWKGQTEDARPHFCVAHSCPETKLPATFSASFEAREETKKFYEPLELGQPQGAKPLWANLGIDTILINDCLGPIGRGNDLLSKKGFGRSLLESPAWHQIQHLALDWTNYRSADARNGTGRVLTKEILKMRSIKTVTIITDYAWNTPDGDTDSFVGMGDEVGKINVAGLIRRDENERAAAAYDTFAKKVEVAWKDSVRLASLANFREGITITPKVELKVMMMNMAGGPIDKYWDRG